MAKQKKVEKEKKEEGMDELVAFTEHLNKYRPDLKKHFEESFTNFKNDYVSFNNIYKHIIEIFPKFKHKDFFEKLNEKVNEKIKELETFNSKIGGVLTEKDIIDIHNLFVYLKNIDDFFMKISDLYINYLKNNNINEKSIDNNKNILLEEISKIVLSSKK
jgi:hypothetical protein